MKTATNGLWRYGLLMLVFLGFTGTATAQRTVTLTLNAATIPDTTGTEGLMEVRGAVKGVAPITLADGNVIDWSDASTLEATNIGGDYWQMTFQIADTTELTHKFYSQSAEDAGVNGWEADPNPVLMPGANDTTLAVHFFESQSEYRGMSGDRGEYDWRPWEAKEDTIAVWFRVFMRTEVGVNKGYSRDSLSQVIAIRGADTLNGIGTPLSWGDNLVTLSAESDDDTKPGYDIFSGVAYFDDDLAGETQAYKFIINNDGWEDSPDRTFTIPSTDTTLHWVYFSNSPAASGEEPVASDVLFTVDLDALESIGIFRKARGDTIEVRGGFNGWDCPAPGDDCLLQDVPGTNQFERAITISQIPMSTLDYKFFLNFDDTAFEAEFGSPPPGGWEEGYQTGVNRVVTFDGTAQQDLGVTAFNEVRSENVIPEGVSIDVNFSVNMDSTDAIMPFNAAGGDSVMIQIEDPIFGWTQDIDLFIDGSGDDRPDIHDLLTDDDSDNVYTGTFTINGPTYGVITWRYKYGQRDGAGVFTGFTEPGSGLGATPGRNRAHWIQPNPDGTWPASVDLTHDFQPSSEPLPFNENTVAVEQIGSDLPESVTLLSNYPNPFNESTTFDYTVTAKTQVTIGVYNVIGQHVATVVDAVQPAGTYRATFDAKGLASGTYFYRLEADGKVISKPMILVR